MPKPNFDFPLPLTNLHERYDPIFAALKKGLSATLIGLPLSSRSAYFKFIVEYTSLLSQFIDSEGFDFKYIGGKHLSDAELTIHIALGIASSQFVSEKQKQNLHESIRINDPLLIQTKTLEIVKEIKSGKIVLCLFDADDILPGKPESLEFLLNLVNINKHRSSAGGVLLFSTASPKFFDILNTSEFVRIRPIFEDQLSYFTLHSDTELDYVRQRLESFRGASITNPVHALAKKLSFGHYLLYKTLSQESVSTLKALTSVTNSSISSILETLAKSLRAKERKDWTWKCFVPFKPLSESPLFNPSLALSEGSLKNIDILTAQEALLLETLLAKTDLLSRDEVAQRLWGADWTNKYSDWAIDKVVSNLKRKIKDSDLKLITLRNRGYKLVKYV